MNEVESNTPVTETEFEDSFDSIADEIINENNDLSNEGETTSEETELEENQTESEGETQKEIDFKPFLDYLSKNVKYNKEAINVENIEEVINNFQKGLNYEKLQTKYSDLENSKALNYINKKASEIGVSIDEYMEQVEAYEREQERQKDEEKLQQMIENGVPEDIAKEVIATSQLRKELQEEKTRLAKEKEQQEIQTKKDKEYDDFIKEFPNVKAEDIPKEVFESANAKGQTLLQSYKDFLYEEMKKEVEQIKNNIKNESQTIGATQNFGEGNNNEGKDLFLEGFDS